jgi:hypothetical protein
MGISPECDDRSVDGYTYYPFVCIWSCNLEPDTELGSYELISRKGKSIIIRTQLVMWDEVLYMGFHMSFQVKRGRKSWNIIWLSRVLDDEG